jgi:purine nucleoside permease
MADNTGAQAPDPATLAQIRSETAQANATASRNDIEDGRGGIDIRTAQARIHAAQVAEAAAVGSGFKFTPEQIETQLTQCQELIFQYNQALLKARRAYVSVHAPAPDEAGSVLQANQTQQSLTNLHGVIESQVQFLEKWHNTLTEVKAKYLQTEQGNESRWQQLAKGLQA